LIKFRKNSLGQEPGRLRKILKEKKPKIMLQNLEDFLLIILFGKFSQKNFSMKKKIERKMKNSEGASILSPGKSMPKLFNFQAKTLHVSC